MERFRQAARISCPALIVQGSLSDVFTSDDAQELAKEFQHGEFAQVGEAGHTVQGDNPRVFAEVLERFLGRVLPDDDTAAD